MKSTEGRFQRQSEEPTRKPLQVSRARADRLLCSLRRPADIAADLTIVEEVDTHTNIGIQDMPTSPSKPATQTSAPRRSLGAVSEMSGTTAISSFTLVEAETLEPRFIIRHLPRLHDEALEFLDHLVPAEGDMRDDVRCIQLLQDQTSDFSADYNDFDRQLRTRLVHYRGQHHQYIHLRAVHAALFGANRDTVAAHTGLDLVLYQANLIVFAKTLMPLEQHDKSTVEVLRELDNSFPSLFLPTLTLGIDTPDSISGESTLLQETFELALELRTQLAIMSLSRGSADDSFDPDAALDELFFNPSSDSTQQIGLIRGWNTSALGGEEFALPDEFVQQVITRMAAIRDFFSTEEGSQGQEGTISLDGLAEEFPWTALILRLMAWVRARNQEIMATIRRYGGVDGTLSRVKAERDRSTAAAETIRRVSQLSPRKNRSSFGRNRRRSSGKFDPNAEVDTEVLSRLMAREGAVQASSLEDVASLGPIAQETQSVVEDEHEDVEARTQQNDGRENLINISDKTVGDEQMESEVVPRPMPEASQQPRSVSAAELSNPSQLPSSGSSRPPRSTNDFVSILKETRASDKENRGTSLFERQANAQRVDFGDGFGDSQSTPGPSRSQPTAGPTRKGKEPKLPSPKKRKIVEISHDDDDDEDDAFETEQRSANVERRRENAPKRVRIDPMLPGAPPSHQPQVRDDGNEFRPIEDFQQPENEEPSEPEAPEMTEDAPPRSTFDDIKSLARANTIYKPRRAKKAWSVVEEEALIMYMSDFTRQYSRILAVDKASRRKYFHVLENGEWVAQRSQVDLKDKARVMAKNMIK